MMTAEEFVEFLEAKGTIFPNEKEKLRAKNSFIEFAKIHVAEALNAAYSTVEYWVSGIDEVKEDILSSYPLENIK
jgi:hypothetical protein